MTGTPIHLPDLAAEVRRNLVKHYGDDMKAACLKAAEDLSTECARAGFFARVVKGTFWIDNPDPENYTEWDPDDFKSQLAMDRAMHEPLHYWVEVIRNNRVLILDIAASQFNGELDGIIMPDIVCAAYSDALAERYHKAQVRRKRREDSVPALANK